jgi:ketosteroid isomerase-like protein
MSQENVDRFRAGWEAWRRGDLEEWLESMDPALEWDLSAYPLPDVPERGRGRDRFVGWMAEYFSAWDRYEPTLKDVIDAGDDDVVAVIHETIYPSGGTTPLERDVFNVYTVSQGRAVRLRAFRTRQEALAAVRLRE